MRYRKLGNTGLDVSVIGLGANNFGGRLDFDQTKIVLDQVLDEGINLIDTSNSYGNTLSEEYIGRALENRRESVVLATKVSTRMGEGPNQAGNSRKHIMDQVEKKSVSFKNRLYRFISNSLVGSVYTCRRNIESFG